MDEDAQVVGFTIAKAGPGYRHAPCPLANLNAVGSWLLEGLCWFYAGLYENLAPIRFLFSENFSGMQRFHELPTGHACAAPKE